MTVSETKGGGSREWRQGKYAGGRMSRGGFDVGGEEKKVQKIPRVSVRAAEIRDEGCAVVGAGGGGTLVSEIPRVWF